MLSDTSQRLIRSVILALIIGIIVSYFILPLFYERSVDLSNIHDIYAAVFTALIITSITFFVLGISGSFF